MQPEDIVEAIVETWGFDIYSQKREVKPGVLYIVESVDNLFSTVKLQGLNGASFAQHDFRVIEFPNVFSMPILDEFKSTNDEGCKHINKRASFYHKSCGEKVIFNYCPDCKKEV